MPTKSKHIYQDRIYSLLSGRAVLVHPLLKEVTGTVNGALWLAQMLYWYDKGDSAGCIRKSRSALTKETGLTRDQQIRVEKELKKRGIVTIVVKPGRPSPINHITLDIDVIEKFANDLRGIRILDDEEKPQSKSVLSVHQGTINTENISETTPKNTHNKEKISEKPGYQSAVRVAEILRAKSRVL